MNGLSQSCRDLATKVDRAFGTSLKETGGRYYRFFLTKWSPLRRILDPLVLRLKYRIRMQPSGDIRLHLGCGWKHLEGYINVDMWITDATDMICDVTKLPWPDNSVSVIESYHVIEHISHRKIKEVLETWHCVLKPGGKLVLECPHFDEAVREYLAGNEHRLINVFGWQRSQGDYHLYGYNPLRLMRLLEEIGFEEIHETSPRSSQVLDEPCFRIECKKPHG